MNTKGAIYVTTTVVPLVCFLYVSKCTMVNHAVQNDIEMIVCQAFVFLVLLTFELWLNYYFFKTRKNTIRVNLEAKRGGLCTGIRIDGKRRMPYLKGDGPSTYVVKPGNHTVEMRSKGKTIAIQIEDVWKSTVYYLQDCDSVGYTVDNEKYDETVASRMEKEACYISLLAQVLVMVMSIGGFCYIVAMNTW